MFKCLIYSLEYLYNIFDSKQFKETSLLYNVNEMDAMIKLEI